MSSPESPSTALRYLRHTADRLRRQTDNLRQRLEPGTAEVAEFAYRCILDAAAHLDQHQQAAPTSSC